jgi:nucleosome binding factor SPN SPT16 subunit
VPPPRGASYSLLLGDTVQVTDAGARLLTQYKLALEDVSYKLSDDGEAPAKEVKAEAAASSASAAAALPGSKVVRSRTRGEEKEESTEAARRGHQKQLFEERQRQNVRRFQRNAPTAEEDAADQVRRVEAYKHSSLIPRDVKPNKVRWLSHGSSLATVPGFVAHAPTQGVPADLCGWQARCGAAAAVRPGGAFPHRHYQERLAEQG